MNVDERLDIQTRNIKRLSSKILEYEGLKSAFVIRKKLDEYKKIDTENMLSKEKFYMKGYIDALNFVFEKKSDVSIQKGSNYDREFRIIK